MDKEFIAVLRAKPKKNFPRQAFGSQFFSNSKEACLFAFYSYKFSGFVSLDTAF